MTGNEWVERLAADLGVPPPTPEEVDDLLGLAGIAAHTSERTAAPLSTWLAGRAGISVAQAKEAVRRLADRAAGEGAGTAGSP